MRRRCTEVLAGDRCELPAGHEGDIHRRGSHTWGFRDIPEPEWMRRRRTIGLPAKEMPL